ncbi:MAG: hypothetical protein E6342_17940 [Clostridium sp.]|uniref:hypothetical protein n=1 Tax=Clostridium sp. TaxID=1506 RepID=UPI001F23A041|nr:hypothetical protein [Clostridium sp.]MDU4844007.1 hypothetical protein [Leclercia adecarboxylata]MDU7089569.1 hypothetical protein [Clostridium sp.]
MYKVNEILRSKCSGELFKVVCVGPEKLKHIDDKLTTIREITLERAEYDLNKFNIKTEYDYYLNIEFEKYKCD